MRVEDLDSERPSEAVEAEEEEEAEVAVVVVDLVHTHTFYSQQSRNYTTQNNANYSSKLVNKGTIYQNTQSHNTTNKTRTCYNKKIQTNLGMYCSMIY